MIVALPGLFSYFFFSMLLYYKGNNSKMGDNSDEKKIRVTYFFMRNPYMKFQNISIYGTKLMLCT